MAHRAWFEGFQLGQFSASSAWESVVANTKSYSEKKTEEYTSAFIESYARLVMAGVNPFDAQWIAQGFVMATMPPQQNQPPDQEQLVRQAP